MRKKKLITQIVDRNIKAGLEHKLQDRDIEKLEEHIEETAKASEQKYRRLFESSQDGILILNAHSGIIIESNSNIERMLGYHPKELIGEKFTDLQAFKAVTPNEEDFLIFKKEKNQRYTGIPMLTKDGNTLFVDFNANQFKEGKTTLIHANIRDVTELIYTNIKFEEALTHAKESDRLKSAFLANMSHDIRTPLNAIIGFSSLLHGNVSNEDKEHYLSIIHKSSYSLLSLIDDIINLSIIESGKLNLKFKSTSLNELLKQTYTVHDLEMKPQVNLVLDTPSEKHYSFIKTDPERLSQILNNLIGNARKFTKEGEIRFGYRILDDKNLEFFVKDTGKGIPEYLQKDIFERFKQNPDNDTQKGSAGLGLAISKALVNMLGGDMKLESEENKGTTFSFTHPYNKTESILTEVTRNTMINLLAPKGTLLLVDDDEASKSLMSYYLKEGKYTTLYAKNGKEAVDLVKSHDDIRIVLMDMRMPIMDGYAATREIRKNKTEKELPIIAVTAHALNEDKEKCIQAGCNDYISKPVLKPDLLSKIVKYMK